LLSGASRRRLWRASTPFDISATMLSTPVLVRLPPGFLSELDAWIAAQRDPLLTRPEAMRRLTKERLTGAGATAHSAEDVAELRRKFIMLVRRVDELIAARRL
jgi:hypothetical protein